MSSGSYFLSPLSDEETVYIDPDVFIMAVSLHL